MLNGTTADFVLLVDTAGQAPATTQRLYGMMMTSPRDTSGSTPTLPDDIFHPDYGVGLPQMVDQLQSVDLADEIVSRITSGMAADPGVAVPTPVQEIVVDFLTPDETTINVGQYVSVSGAAQALPSISL